MKKVVALMLVLVLGLCFVNAIAESEHEPVTITFWNINGSEIRTNMFQKLIGMFEEKYPWITVEYFGLPFEEANQKLAMAAQTGTLPDCSDATINAMVAMAAMNALEPLDGYIDTHFERESISNNFIASVKGMDPIEGRLLYMPIYAQATHIWYRKDLLEAAGVEPPKTIEEFYEAVAKLTDEEKGVYGWGFRGGAGNHYEGTILIANEAGITSYFDEEGNCNFKSDRAVEAITNYTNIYKNGYSPKNAIEAAYMDLTTDFGNGITCMFAHHLGSLAQLRTMLDDSQIGYLPLPLNKDGFRSTKLDPSGMCMYATSQHKEETWKFIEFMSSAEASVEWLLGEGGVPANVKTLELDPISKDPFIAAAIDMINDPNTRIIPEANWLTDYWTYRNENVFADIQAIIMGEKDAGEAVLEWGEAWGAMQKEYLAESAK